MRPPQLALTRSTDGASGRRLEYCPIRPHPHAGQAGGSFVDAVKRRPPQSALTRSTDGASGRLDLNIVQFDPTPMLDRPGGSFGRARDPLKNTEDPKLGA